MISSETKVQAGAAVGLAGLMTWMNCRPLGIIFFTLLAAVAYKQIYPNAHFQVPCEVQNNLNTIYESFTKLRKDKPGAFTVIVSGGLATVAVAGHLISGTWLILGVLIGVFFLCAKYQVKLVHGEDEAAKRSQWDPQTNDYEIDEFLPDVSDEANISLLNKVSENVDVSHLYRAPNASVEDESEVPSDLLPTSERIPDIEEEEATASFPSSLEDDLVLPQKEPQQYDAPPLHFGDSSDDSDDSISRGLNFNDVTLPDAPRSGADGSSARISASSSSQPALNPSSGGLSPSWNIVNNLWDAAQSTFPELMVGRTAPPPPPRRRAPSRDLSSDESDFEFLDTDDLNVHSNT